MRPNPIIPTVDFEKDGIQHGHLKLPYSWDESAWGAIMIPVTVVKNEDGPTALLTGGNHGDEYEGPVALFDLANTLKLEEISGRIILVPAMNFPAFQAGKRTSPIDSGNMNRVFPGKPGGTVTEKIADFFQRTLLPLSDFVLDIHSGGKTLDFVSFCAAHELPDKAQEQRCVAAMQAFNAPYSLKLLELDATGMYDTAAEEMGKVFISTELGGGGGSTAASVAIAKKGVRNFLKHAQILSGTLETAPTLNLDMPDYRCYVTSESSGLLEMCVDLGSRVQEGELLAKVHDIHRTDSMPTEYHSKRNGILMGRHFPGLIDRGDPVAVVAVEV